MKKLLFILLSLIYSANILAQSVKLVTDEQDPYTKSKVKETNFTIMCDNMSKVLSVKGRSIDGKPRLILRVVMGSGFSIDNGDEIIVLTKSGETVHLKCSSGGMARSSEQAYGPIRWNLEATYSVEPAELEILSRQEVKGVRVYLGSEYYDFDKIKEKNATDIREVLKAVI